MYKHIYSYTYIFVNFDMNIYSTVNTYIEQYVL